MGKVVVRAVACSVELKGKPCEKGTSLTYYHYNTQAAVEGEGAKDW